MIEESKNWLILKTEREEMMKVGYRWDDWFRISCNVFGPEAVALFLNYESEQRIEELMKSSSIGDP